MPSNDSHIVLALAEEFLERYRKGEKPSLKEYIDRRPDLAAEIQEVFPAMALMENIALAEESLSQASGGRQPPGPLQQLGDYRIIREVGRGGMGVVYEAEQVSLGRHVALKVLPQQTLLDERSKRRFEREARAAAKLHHTNIVPVFGVGEHEGLPYYVMQFIQGLGLDEVLKELKRCNPNGTTPAIAPTTAEPPPASELSVAHLARSLVTGHFEPGNLSANGPSDLSIGDSGSKSSSSISLPGQSDGPGKSSAKRASYWQSVAHIGVQVAGALEHAHKQGILHRDVKPSNLLLDLRGNVWVTDFGLAKLNDQQDLTHTGDVLGTLRFMPPEAFNGHSDARSDVYSLGLTLYELLAFRPAFDEKDRNKLIKQVTTTDPPQLNKLSPAVPRDLTTIVHKAIDKEPNRRYQTANELAADLQRFLDDEPIRARRTSAAERLRRWCRRNPAVAGLLAVVATMLLVTAAGATWAAFHFGRMADQAQRLKDDALAQAEESRRRLVGQYVANGERLVEEDDPTAALAWFAEAFDLDKRDARREEVHRIRLASWLRRYPRLAGVWRLPGAGLDGDFSADGRRVLAVSSEGRAQVWDATKQQPLGPPFADSVTEPIRIRRAISADGRWVALPGRDKMVRFWDAETGRVLAAYQAEGTPRSEEFSPDGRTVAVGFNEGYAVLLDVQTGKPAAEPLKHDAAVVSVAFSPDGRRLVTGSDDRTAKVWDVSSGKLLRTLPNPFPVSHVSFSPDVLAHKSRLVTVSANEARVWDDADQPTHSLRHSNITFAAFSPDGRQLVTFGGVGGSDHKVRVWDTGTGKLLATLDHSSWISHAAFSPDGGRVLTACFDRTVRVWDTAGKPLTPRLQHGSFIWHADFAADGRQVVVAGRDGLMRTWELTGAPPNALGLRHDGLVDRAAFSPDGRRVVTCSRDRTARVWDVATGQLLATLTHANTVTWAAFSPDSRLVATASTDRTARVWRADTGEAVTPPLPHPHALGKLAFSPDGRLLVTSAGGVGLARISDAEAAARVWEIASARLFVPPLRETLAVGEVAFSPDGRLVLTTGIGGVHLWETATGREVTPPIKDNRGMPRAQFSPDGRRVVMAGHGSARVWDVATGQDVFPPLAHSNIVWWATFSPDGRRIVTASEDRTARLWDAETGQPLSPPWQHRDLVSHASFSPDGRRVATGSRDNRVRVWDVETGQMLAMPWAHRGGSGGGWGRALFCPDGRHLLTCDINNTAYLWDLPLEADDRPADDLIAEARLLAGQHVDSRSGLATLDAGELQDTWQALAARSPRRPAPTPADDLAWHRREAEDCLQEGKWQGVMLHLDHVFKTDPGRWQDWFARGKAHAGLKQWDRALADYTRAAELGGDDKEFWYRKGLAHHELQQWEPSRHAFTKALDRDPTWGSAWHYRAAVNNQLARWQDAVADATKAMERGERNAWISYHRGRAHAELGHVEEAIRDLSDSVADNKDMSGAWNLRGECYVKQRKWREAADDFARVFELHPDQVSAGYLSALLRLQAEDKDGYRAHCAVLLKRLSGASSERANALVWGCVVGPGGVDDYEPFLQRMEQVVRDVPGSWLYLNTLGAALYRAGRHEDAVRRLNEGIATHGKGGAAQDWLFLAMAHHRRGHADEARKWLDKAVRELDRPDRKNPATGEPPAWSDEMECRLLRREAEALLGARAPPKKGGLP